MPPLDPGSFFSPNSPYNYTLVGGYSSGETTVNAGTAYLLLPTWIPECDISNLAIQGAANNASVLLSVGLIEFPGGIFASGAPGRVVAHTAAMALVLGTMTGTFGRKRLSGGWYSLLLTNTGSQGGNIKNLQYGGTPGPTPTLGSMNTANVGLSASTGVKVWEVGEFIKREYFSGQLTYSGASQHPMFGLGIHPRKGEL